MTFETQPMSTPLPISLEFFPPKTPEGFDKLTAVRQQLYALQPQYCSVTYGAGGSTQDGTIQTVRAILNEGFDAAPHFSCIGASKASVREQLQQFQQDGIRRLVALRGWKPKAGCATTGHGLGVAANRHIPLRPQSGCPHAVAAGGHRTKGSSW